MATAVASASARVLWRHDDDSNVFSSPSSLLPYFSPTEWCRRRRGIRCEGEDKQSWQSLSSSLHGREARHRKTEHLWHEFFADPSQWWDNRLTKKNPKQPDFKHKRTLEALCMDCWWNPSWVKERLRNLDSISHIKQRNPSCNDGEFEMAQKLCKEGRLKDAINLMECMAQRTSIENAPKATYISLLKECTKRKMLTEGKRVHALIVQSNCDSNVLLANHLIRMYSKCISLQDACTVFNAMPLHDIFSWTAIISAYVDCGKCEEAINLYKEMEKSVIAPDSVLCTVILKACARTAALETGKQIHSLILEKEIHLDVALQSALVDMYAKCGCLDNARDLFNKMSERDVVSWSAMIAGYAQNGLGVEAISLYKQMKQEGVEGNGITFVSVLKACASIGALEQGKQIHSLIVEKGFHVNIIVQSALVDMYAKCGCLDNARDLFNKMTKQDVVSWNAMIAGYAQNGLGQEAIVLYKQMKQEGVEADGITFVCVLKACASIGALEQGKQIHSLILEKGFHVDTVVQNALVDMYAKCGCLDNARHLFNKMSDRNVVSWNAMIAGYAQNGLGMEAIALYKQMKQEGMEANGVLPDDITYILVLSACSHLGLVNEGFLVFDFLCRYSGVIPTLKHYACMVDLLGRAGLLVEAKDFIRKMPIQPDRVVWMSLLGAARNVGNLEIGQHAFYNIVKLDPQRLAPYLLLIDIFARAGQMDKVAEITRTMTDKGLKKIPGCNCCEVDNEMHAFVISNENHPQSQQIWTQLTTLLR